MGKLTRRFFFNIGIALPLSAISIKQKDGQKFPSKIRKIIHHVPVKCIDYEPRGACRELFTANESRVIITGPAGSGKTRACLEKANWLLERYPGIRGLMVRKEHLSLIHSAMVTFEREVLLPNSHVPWNAANLEYRYPNGSLLMARGLENIDKLLASEFDFIFVNHAEELTEDEWNILCFRSKTQTFGDCTPNELDHWILKQEAIAEHYPMTWTFKILQSAHTDNPLYWNASKEDWTERGRQYVEGTLKHLEGIQKKRLYDGEWASMYERYISFLSPEHQAHERRADAGNLLAVL